MTNEQKDAVASVLISQKFSKGQTIVNEGDPASSFYIIKEVLSTKIFLEKIGYCPSYEGWKGNQKDVER